MPDTTNTPRKARRGNSNASLPDITLLGKKPPQAPELEEAVLAALMLEKDALNHVVDILRPDHFYVDRHRAVYEAIIALFNTSDPIDLLTVTNMLRKQGTIELAGGPSAVTLLTTKANSAANIIAHARIVQECAIKREVIQVSGQVLADAYEDTTDALELLDRTEQELFNISEANIRKNYADMSSLMRQVMKEIEEKRNQKDGLTGVASGFTALDRVTSGWQRSDLLILAARPGMGKTALVLSLLRNAAVDFDKPAAIFSLEMSQVQLMNRLLSAEAELDSKKIQTGKLEDYEMQQLVHKTSRLAKAKIFIDDTPALSILELRAKCRRLKSQNDIQLIIIDYLQLMQGDTSKNLGGNREQEIAGISRALKQLAKELNVPVIALSQLSRAVETRGGDKRPQLSDLRESGSIEQDADMVLFIYRPDYYGLTEDENGQPLKGTAEIIIAKNRHGSVGSVWLRFIDRFTKFIDLDDDGASLGGLGAGGGFYQGGGSFAQASPQPPPSNFGGGGRTFGSKMNTTDFDPKGPGEDVPF
ncbi:MAG: replicative DNA helicase [Bernardetiaceae bacterium]|nr:replicative DNA helicase [Bernardetiaceae bacterium]